MHNIQNFSTGKRNKDMVPFAKLKLINDYNKYMGVQIKAMLWSAVALASKKLTSVPEIFFSITLNR